VSAVSAGVDGVDGVADSADSAVVDVLVPTCGRPAALAVTLAALGASSGPPIRIVVSDQSAPSSSDSSCPASPAPVLSSCASAPASSLDGPEVAAVLRYLRARGIAVDTFRHLPRRGMAEQRAFLLAQARAPYCLFLDDDVIVEPDLVARLHAALREQRCGFAGSAVHGLSYLGQLRPEQEAIAFWEGRVQPETVRPGTAAWARHHLHSAANLFHVQSRLAGVQGWTPGPHAPAAHPPTCLPTRLYRVAWIGGCVLFDTGKLRAAGGFDFWRDLPGEHCGEDVLAQLRVMERFGGCGILPSGAYHMELPTTVSAREVDAPLVLLDAAGRA